jgi:hypothetical protein
VCTRINPNPAPSNSVTSQRRIAGSLPTIVEFEKFSVNDRP